MRKKIIFYKRHKQIIREMTILESIKKLSKIVFSLTKLNFGIDLN